MRIKELQLENYGIYKNEIWTPSLFELNVVMGENESGKTTLLRFARDMLFGYERGQWLGRLGHMELIHQGMSYYMHRMEKNKWLESEKGVRYEKEMSELWWHGLTRSVYEKIFALGLEDLQGSSFFFNEAVQSKFFMLQGGAKIIEAKVEVEGEKEKLLVASTIGKRKINQLMAELKKLQEEIDHLANQEIDFSALQKEQNSIKSEIREKEIQLKKDKKENNYVEKWIGAREYYKRAVEIKTQLEVGQGIKNFPINGKERWTEIINRMKVIDGQKKMLREKIDSYTPKRKGEIIPWMDLTDELEMLYVDLGKWRQIINDVETLKNKKNEWRRSFTMLGYTLPLWDRPLKPDDIGMTIDWDEGRKLSQSVTVRENELHFWKQREPEVEILKETACISPIISTEKEWRDYEIKANQLEELIRKEKTLSDQDKAEREKEERTHTMWSVCAIVCLLASVTAIILFYMSFLGYEGIYGAIGGTIVSLIFFAINHYTIKKEKQKKIDVAKEWEKVKVDKEKLAHQIGDNAPLIETDLPAFRNDMQEKRSEFYKYQAEQQALAWKRETIKKQEADYQKWKTEGKELKKSLENMREQWEKWISDNNLPNVSAEQLPQLQEQWQKISAVEAKGKILDVRLHSAEEQSQLFYERAKKIIRTAGIQYLPTPDSIAEIHDENIKRNLEWQSISEKNRQHDMYKQELMQAEEAWNSCQKDLDALFSLVDADDADEFVMKINAYENHDRLVAEWEQIRNNIRSYAGNDTLFDKLWNDLKTGSDEVWQNKHSDLCQEMETLTEDIGRLHQKEGAVGSEIMRLAGDDTITEKLQKKKEIEAELEGAMEEWLTALFVQKILEKAGHYYESGQQPNIIKAANEFLQSMTDEKYSIAVDSDGKDITIFDRYHIEKSSRMWSSGTGDQVYLALRLAMALSFGQQVEPLPIILDDIFVRFDETRQKETLRFLLELGKTQQVFLFTCHAHTMKLAQELGQETQSGAFFKLERGHIQNLVQKV